MNTRVSPLALALAASIGLAAPAGAQAASFDLAKLPRYGEAAAAAPQDYGAAPALALAGEDAVPRAAPPPSEEAKPAVAAPQPQPSTDPALVATQVRAEEAGRRAAPTWQNVRTHELVFQALNLVDLAQTASCLSAHRCSEANPILGRNPSIAALVGLKLGTGLIHFAATRWLLADHPGAVKPFLWGTILLQGGVVGLNMRHVF